MKTVKARARIAQPAGGPYLSDPEIVALAAGTTEVKAVELLRDLGGLRGLYHAGRGELAEKLGPAAAARLFSSRDLCQRLEAAITSERDKLGEPVRVWRWAQKNLARMDHEQLYMLALDGQHGLITSRQIAEGGIHGMNLGVRDVLRAAIREAASAFILLHVHPSGDPSPSPEDVAFTKALLRGAKEIGTPMIDHIVVARGGYTSMMELGLV